MSGTVLKIEVPMLPPKQLSPNARVHWRVRHQYASEFRAWAMFRALETSKYTRPRFNKAEVSICFIVHDNRHIRDTDNALASLKPAIDGCVDAEIITDDNPDVLIYRMPIDWEVDKHRAPKTILEFREIE